MSRLPIGLAAAAFVFHLAFAGRYDFFRDELYFIACGRHPAFGYADQPPLIPLLAAGSQLFGHDLVLLRAIAALGAALAVYMTALLARLAGGGAFATVFASALVAFAPVSLGVATNVGTSTFEPFFWAVLAYCAARLILKGERRMLLLAGLACGVALECKYEIEFYVLALAIGFALVPERKMLLCRELLYGIAIAAIVAAPSLLWQAAHGWPFAQLIVASRDKDVALDPLSFTLQQLLAWNPASSLIWIAGALAPFWSRPLRAWRAISIAFLTVFAIMLALHAKDYYVIGAYAPVMAIGAVWWERTVRSPIVRGAYVAWSTLVAAVIAPLVVPVLSPAQLAAYLERVPLHSAHNEKGEAGEVLPQHFADQLGWRDVERQVAAVYRALPPADRARAGIYVSNYGLAGAIDFYGGDDHLPPALSGHNQYFLWGPRGYDGSVLIAMPGNPATFVKRCTSATVAARTSDSVFLMPFERNRPIIVCRGLHPDLQSAWPGFKYYY